MMPISLRSIWLMPVFSRITSPPWIRWGRHFFSWYPIWYWCAPVPHPCLYCVCASCRYHVASCGSQHKLVLKLCFPIYVPYWWIPFFVVILHCKMHTICQDSNASETRLTGRKQWRNKYYVHRNVTVLPLNDAIPVWDAPKLFVSLHNTRLCTRSTGLTKCFYFQVL